MASRVDSAHGHAQSSRELSPAIPVVLLVGAVAVANVALNRLFTLFRETLPPILQFEYVVSVPFTPAAAGVLLATAGVAVVLSLALFVESLGGGSTAPDRVSRLWRATGVGVVGALAVVAGLSLFVLPGLVVLLYLPFVFVSVVLDGSSLADAVAASHDRLTDSPAVVVTTVFGMALCLLGIGLGGIFSSVLTPTAEFLVGGVASVVITLAGMRRLTSLYRRLPAAPAGGPGQSGRL